jgi:ring-1,2-phenylacetyl-CoA epoxidase subunit PaaC
LILGHRNSEWTGHGPILEEDIAFANIALDELGHAAIWYGLLQAITGDDPDRLVFFRAAAAYRNAPFFELPKGDWAFGMLRQYLFDAFELVYLQALAQSAYQPLADAADKICRDEIYHLRHSQAWIKRLSLGTDESHRRTQQALDQLWPYTYQLFDPLPGEARLIEASYVPDLTSIRQGWEDQIRPTLTALTIPEEAAPAHSTRQTHTPHLVELLAEMQAVARSDPEAIW